MKPGDGGNSYISITVIAVDPVELDLSQGQRTFTRLKGGFLVIELDPMLAPRALVATTVQLAMVQPADRQGELVADLASHRPLLCELDVRRGSAADQTWLGGQKPQMLAVALTHRFAYDDDRLVTGVGLRRLAAVICFLVFRWGERP